MSKKLQNIKVGNLKYDSAKETLTLVDQRLVGTTSLLMKNPVQYANSPKPTIPKFFSCCVLIPENTKEILALQKIEEYMIEKYGLQDIAKDSSQFSSFLNKPKNSNPNYPPCYFINFVSVEKVSYFRVFDWKERKFYIHESVMETDPEAIRKDIHILSNDEKLRDTADVAIVARPVYIPPEYKTSKHKLVLLMEIVYVTAIKSKEERILEAKKSAAKPIVPDFSTLAKDYKIITGEEHPDAENLIESGENTAELKISSTTPEKTVPVSPDGIEEEEEDPFFQTGNTNTKSKKKGEDVPF